MARLDRKEGRFDVQYEYGQIDAALAGYQSVYGQELAWYRFSHELSQTHDIYDEGAGVGRVFHPPVTVPVLAAVREEGQASQETGGLYWTDAIHLTASFAQITKTGLTRMDVKHGTYLRDRIAYDGRIFRVTRISVLGQIISRDIVVGIDAVQLKASDLTDDAQFEAWATGDGDLSE
jgi:hypothetical protein